MNVSHIAWWRCPSFTLVGVYLLIHTILAVLYNKLGPRYEKISRTVRLQYTIWVHCVMYLYVSDPK